MLYTVRTYILTCHSSLDRLKADRRMRNGRLEQTLMDLGFPVPLIETEGEGVDVLLQVAPGDAMVSSEQVTLEGTSNDRRSTTENCDLGALR